MNLFGLIYIHLHNLKVRIYKHLILNSKYIASIGYLCNQLMSVKENICNHNIAKHNHEIIFFLVLFRVSQFVATILHFN